MRQDRIIQIVFQIHRLQRSLIKWWNQRVFVMQFGCPSDRLYRCTLCIFIPLWQHCKYTVHSTSQCTVLSFAFAHFAKLDSVLWGKLEKLCQFKVLNSTKQTLYFLGIRRENASRRKCVLLKYSWHSIYLISDEHGDNASDVIIIFSLFPCDTGLLHHNVSNILTSEKINWMQGSGSFLSICSFIFSRLLDVVVSWHVSSLGCQNNNARIPGDVWTARAPRRPPRPGTRPCPGHWGTCSCHVSRVSRLHCQQ